MPNTSRVLIATMTSVVVQASTGSGASLPNTPYRWTVHFNVAQASHNDATTPRPLIYDGRDVVVGDWFADFASGKTVKIISVSSKTAAGLNAVVEDVGNFNAFADPDGLGINSGQGAIFQVDAANQPLLTGMTLYEAAVSQNVAWAVDQISRFRFTDPAAAGGGGAIAVQKSGTEVTAAASAINFVGAGVGTVVADGAGVVSVTVSGGGGGGAADSSLEVHGSLPSSLVLDSAANHVFTLSANWTITDVSATAVPGNKLTANLYLKQPASAPGKTVTWPGNILWDGGQIPILSITANKIDIVYLESIDDGVTWIGAQIGGNI